MEERYAPLEKLCAVFGEASVNDVVGRFFWTAASDARYRADCAKTADSFKPDPSETAPNPFRERFEQSYRQSSLESHVKPHPLGGEPIDAQLAEVIERHRTIFEQRPNLMEMLRNPDAARFSELVEALQQIPDIPQDYRERRQLLLDLEKLRRSVSDYTKLLRVGVPSQVPLALRTELPDELSGNCQVKIKSQYDFISLSRDAWMNKEVSRAGFDEYSGVMDKLFPKNSLGEDEFNVLREMFFNPLTDVGQIQLRQQIIKDLQSMTDTQNLKEAKETLEEYFGAIQELITLYEDDYRSIGDDGGSTLIDMFHMGEEVYEQTIYADENRLSYAELCRKIETALRAMAESAEKAEMFFELLKTVPSLKETGEKLQAAFTSLRTLVDRGFFMEDKASPQEMGEESEKKDTTKSRLFSRYVSLESWKEQHEQAIEDRQAKGHAAYQQIVEINNLATTICAFIDVAKMCQREGWQPITFDPDRPTTYKDAWHAAHHARSQVLNDSPADNPFTVYSGPNDSGKSHSGLQRDLLIYMAAQAWGMVPAGECNLRAPIQNLVFLDRSGTRGEYHQSAFQSEAAELEKNLAHIRERIAKNQKRMPSQTITVRMYLDEPGSATAPADQRQLIDGIRCQISDMGGNLVIASHNEEVIEAAMKDPDAGCYYFGVEIEENGAHRRIQPTYKMQVGMGESHSFDVAERHQADPELVAHARTHDNGELSLHPAPKVLEYPIFKALSAPDRDARKAETRSLDQLFSSAPQYKPHLALILSDDRQLKRDELSPHISWPENITPLRGLSNKLFGSFLCDLPADIEPAEILERQQLFRELGETERLQAVCQALDDLEAVEKSYALIDFARKEGINRALSPFVDEEVPFSKRRAGFVNRTNLKNAYVFLKLNRKLLKTEFPENADALMREIRIMSKILKSKKHGEIIDKLSEVPNRFFFDLPELGQEEEKTLKDIFAKIGTPAAGSDRTLEGLSSYFENLARRMQTIHLSLPQLDFADLDLKAIETELLALCRFEFLTQEEDGKPKPPSQLRNEFLRILNEKDLPYALLQLPAYNEAVDKLTTAMESADSVYLAQAVPHIREIHGAMQKALMTQPDEILAGERTHKGRILWHKHSRDRGFYRFEGRNLQEGLMAQELNRLKALAALAATIKAEQMAAVSFNDTGEIQLENSFHLLRGKAASIPNTLRLENQGMRLQILTGPNGSGKTFFEQQILLSFLSAYATGHAPADTATMPLLRPVLADRLVTNESDKGSFASELSSRWDRVIPLLQGDRPSLLIGDEIFSTVSPRYQRAFIAAVTRILHENGHYGMIATHNHPAVDWACEADPNTIQPFHFGYQINEDGTITYTRNLVKGHAPSHALEAAKTVGLDLRAGLAHQTDSNGEDNLGNHSLD